MNSSHWASRAVRSVGEWVRFDRVMHPRIPSRLRTAAAHSLYRSSMDSFRPSRAGMAYSSLPRSAGNAPSSDASSVLAHSAARDRSSDSFVSFGDVTLPIPLDRADRAGPSRLAWADPFFPMHAGRDREVAMDPLLTAHLRWMAQKDVLGQDMLLYGDPGDFRRELVLLYCAMTGRSLEYVCVHHETAEGDFKQRRELRGRDTVFVDMPAVRAAMQGSVLLIEGLEKAERNVLPVLNNLLENREMHLEDGRFLVSSQTYERMKRDEGKSEDDLRQLGIVRVHADFRVVALALSSSRYPGSPIDPPLRSRFQSRLAHRFSSLERYFERLDRAADVAPAAWAATCKAVLTFFSALRASVESSSSHYRASHALFCERMVAHAAQYLALNPSASARDIVLLMGRLCPPLQDEYFGVKDDVGRERVRLLADLRARLSTSARASVSLRAPGSSPNAAAETESGLRLVSRQKMLAEEALRDLDAGMSVCLFSDGPSGKSVLAEAVASARGQAMRSMLVYKDMSPRELFLRRVSMPDGSTSVQHSPLIEGALDGSVVVLDHIDRLPSETLASLASLIQNHYLVLPDGTTLLPAAWYDAVVSSSAGSERATQGRVFLRVDDKFRVLATATVPRGSRSTSAVDAFASPEVLTMFSYHCVDTMSHPHDVVDILLRAAAPHSQPAGDVGALEADLRRLVQLSDALSRQPAMGARLTLHPMVRIAREWAALPSAARTKDVLAASVARGLLLELYPGTARSDIVSCMRQHGFEYGAGGADAAGPYAAAHAAELEAAVQPASLEHAHLVPRPLYYANDAHEESLRRLRRDFELGHHLFLIGSQGCGKNVLADRLLSMLSRPRQYMQLHRDTTFLSMTTVPTVEAGRLAYLDSPLVLACQLGHVAVIDEADKANPEVVTVLRSLLEGYMQLPDGRVLASAQRAPGRTRPDRVVPIAPTFRLILLANRPGFPFHGNDLMRESELFATHVISNPDSDSELRLLQSYAPSVPADTLARLAGAFAELRHMADEHVLSYPYSTREAIAVAKHMERFPDDDEAAALDNVLAPDTYDRSTMSAIARVFRMRGFALPAAFGSGPEAAGASGATGVVRFGQALAPADGFLAGGLASDPRHGARLRRPPPPTALPKHGKVDPQNERHVGGSTWAGGQGGSDTAGLGGRGGPYRLDSGLPLQYRLSDAEKAQVSSEARAVADAMGREALQAQLAAIDMPDREFAVYESYARGCAGEIAKLGELLRNLEAKKNARSWARLQSTGELDEARLVEAVVGERDVFKRPSRANPRGGRQKEAKRLTIVADCSGSMYSFQNVDNRLQTELSVLVILMEALDGARGKIDYRIVGHSGDEEAIELVAFGSPPATMRDRFRVLEKVSTHAQFCRSGDNTVRGIVRAIDESAKADADEHVVVAISDANFHRYGITPELLRSTFLRHPFVTVRLLTIGSLWGEAEALAAALPAMVLPCFRTEQLPRVMRSILHQTLLKTSS